MREISPGLWHWTARHEHIGVDVSSYYLERERVLLDPILPPDGGAWLEQHGPPENILLTNRHHDRHSWELRERFGCPVHCVRNGMHELEGRGPPEPFDFGDELPGGAIVHEIGAISPDETALYIPTHKALACADGVIHYGEELGFVPDRYMDDPEPTKEGLRNAYARLLELDLDFDILHLAHGDPWVGGAKDALRRFTTSGS
jgi:glyoxylase-like metal-dependent hydrolase (beta-lactamase superfamily II)